MNFNKVTRFTNKAALKFKKNSPQILFYAGITGTVATTVLASRATLKAQPIMEKLRSERAELEQFASEDRVSQDDFHQVAVQQYTEAGVGLVKLYGPVVILGSVSIAALTKSHRELVSRNQALTVAFTGLYETFNRYRERVRTELSPEIDQQFLHGTITQVREIEGKNGTKTKEIQVIDPDSQAALSYWFAVNTSEHWSPIPTFNQSFLDNQQAYANLMLQKQGFLFLNDVYEMLGIPKTKQGQVLGWVFKDLGDNDTFVDFGHNQTGEFVAGYQQDVMLNFNIHGPILELI